MAVVQLDPVSIDPVSDYGTEDDETRRQREAQAAALAMMSDPTRGADTGMPAARRPGALPSYAEGAAMAAPEEIAPRTVRLPQNAPTPAVPASSPARMQTPPSGGGAAKPSSGRIANNASAIAGTDPDMQAAERERDSRRTRNTVVDAIALALNAAAGSDISAVARQAGSQGNANQPIEDLQQRRAEQDRQNARAAQRSEAQRAAELRDAGSEASRSAQESLRALNLGIPDEVLSHISAEDISRNGVMQAFILAQQRAQNTSRAQGERVEGQLAVQDDSQEFRGEDREDTQAHQLQVEEMRATSRRELAELARRHRSGGGGGGGGGQAGLRTIVQRGLMAGGMEEADAAALVSGMSGRTLQSQANTFSGAVLRGAAEGGERAQNRNIDRAARYARETADVAEVEQRVGAVQRLLQGANDSDVREAIGAIQLGETAIAALVESNPRAGQLAMSVSGLQNAQLRIQSGAAVSNQEFSRFRTALGSGSVLSANALRYGIQSTAEAMRAQRQQFDTAYRDVIEWEAAGRPRPSRDINLPGGPGAQPAATPPGTVLIRARNGRVYPVPEANVAAALADGGVRVGG